MIANQADIEALLQIEFDNDPEPKATAVIEAAQRVVEAEVGTPFDLVTGQVCYLTGKGSPTLLLPRWPIAAVNSLVQDGDTLVAGTDFQWNSGGYIDIAEAQYGNVWWSEPNGIVIDYDAGWADETTAPGGLRQLVARVATRIWQNGAAFAENQGASGIVQETIGAYSVTYGDFSKDAAGGMLLDEADRQFVKRFRRRRIGSVQT